MTTKGVYEWATTSINFCRGCSHACVYCYASGMAKRFNRDFPKQMIINQKAVNKQYKKRKGRIMIPTSHDLTPEILPETLIILKRLLEVGNELLITTKPHFDVITAICSKFSNYKKQILFRFTITSMNDNILSIYEPGAPKFFERIKSLSYAYSHGFRTSVSIEPFLDDPHYLVMVLSSSITDTIWIGPMNSKYCPREYRLPIWNTVSLLRLKRSLDTLGTKTREKIRFKDAYLNAIKTGGSK